MLMDMLKDDPRDSFLRYAIGLELNKAGRVHDAIQALNEIQEDDPDYLATYYQLGQFHEQIGQQEKSKSYYEKGIEIALAQREMKILAELREALNLLD